MVHLVVQFRGSTGCGRLVSTCLTKNKPLDFWCLQHGLNLPTTLPQMLHGLIASALPPFLCTVALLLNSPRVPE